MLREQRMQPTLCPTRSGKRLDQSHRAAVLSRETDNANLHMRTVADLDET